MVDVPVNGDFSHHELKHVFILFSPSCWFPVSSLGLFKQISTEKCRNLWELCRLWISYCRDNSRFHRPCVAVLVYPSTQTAHRQWTSLDYFRFCVQCVIGVFMWASFLQIFVRGLHHHSFVVSVVSHRNSMLGRTAPFLMSKSEHKRFSSLEDHFADNSLKRVQSHLSITKHSLLKANPLSYPLFLYVSLC